MPSVRVDDVEVAYEVQGSGDPFVLVHGSTGGRTHWMMQTPTLAERFTVVLPEYAGGGESTTPDRPLEVDELVEQVLAVADDVGAERFHLAGYSLGAVVALALAAAVPDRVQTLTSICGWATSDARQAFTFDLWKRLFEADRELFTRYVLADGMSLSTFEMLGDGIEAIIPMTAGAFAPGSGLHAELDARVDIADRIQKISTPTLVIGGVEDRWVDIAHSRSLAQQISGAHLVELDCGHVALSEKGADVTALLLEHADRA